MAHVGHITGGRTGLFGQNTRGPDLVQPEGEGDTMAMAGESATREWVTNPVQNFLQRANPKGKVLPRGNSATNGMYCVYLLLFISPFSW